MLQDTFNADIMIPALNQSIQDVYYAILNRKLKVHDIAKKTRYSTRTVRYAIKTLINLNVIVQIPDTKDLRSHYYRVVPVF